MAKLEKWKRTLFWIVFIIVAIRIVYIGFRGELNKEYYTSMAYDLNAAEGVPCQNLSESFISQEGRLNSLELIFNNVADDKAGAVTLGIWKGGALLYQTNISLSTVNNGEWKRVVLNAEMQWNMEYTITLNANEECTQIPTVYVVAAGATEITAAYSGDDMLPGAIAINFGYLRKPGIFDRLSVISLWILFVAASFFVLRYFEKMLEAVKGIYRYFASRVNEAVLLAALELLSCLIMISSSGIEFQEPTKIILYIISLLSVVNYAEKRAYIKNLIDRPQKKAFLYFLYLYSAFALTGQRLLAYPLALKLTVARIFVFAVTVFWFVPVVNTLLYYMEAAWKRAFGTEVKQKTIVFVALCVLALWLPAIYNLIANNPGISSADTEGCMVNLAQNLYGVSDWHPAFYSMVLHVIEKISNTTYAVIAVQYFFWAYVVAELLLYLRKKGMKESVLLGAAVFAGCNAGNFMHINTIWKDIPYALSVLWAFVVIVKLVTDHEEYRYKRYVYLELVVSMVGVYFYRKNGVVTFLVITVGILIALRKNRRVWGAMAMTMALIVMVKGPVYHYFEVQDTGRTGIYIGLGQDVLGVYYAGGEVSEDTLEMVGMMTGYNTTEYQYTPTWSYAAYDVDVTPGQFIANYLDTFIKNPVIMLRAVINREDALWDIYAGQDAHLGCVNYSGTMDSDQPWAEQYPARRYMSLSEEMSAATAYTAGSQWISAIEWRCGLFTLLGLVAAAFVILRRGIKKYLVILCPLAGHVLSLLLSTGWSDFRYFWPMNLMNMSLILVVLVIMRQGKEEKEGEGLK